MRIDSVTTFADLEATVQLRFDQTMVIEASDIVEIRELAADWDATTIIELDDHTQVDVRPFGARFALTP